MLRRLAGLMVAGCFAVFSPAAARAGVTYFQVAERADTAEHGDAFVVALSDAAQMAHARDLIDRGPDAAGTPILFATIAPGSDGGVNRDLLADGQPEWNWHVTAVTGFGDFGIELLDGWPTYLSRNLDAWLDTTGPTIGFWSYTVTKELPGYTGGGGSGGGAPAVPLPPAAWAGGAMLLGGAVVRRWRTGRHGAA